MTTYPRTEYEMTEEDFEKLIDSCKPVPMMMIGGVVPVGPQENANRAWKELGRHMGFESETVLPVRGKGERFFTAIPSETPEARVERETRERREARIARLLALQDEIRSKREEIAKELGRRMGFESETVLPVRGKGERFFTAIPSETPEARVERETRERREARIARLLALQDEIRSKREEIAKLRLEANGDGDTEA